MNGYRSMIPLLLLLVVIERVVSLACYDNTDTKLAILRNETSWRYCVVAPASPFDLRSPVSIFGVSAKEDNAELYDTMFGANSAMYQLLSLCMLEKYDFGELAGAAELTFRCVCNFDACNRAVDMDTYLKRMYLLKSSTLLGSSL